MPQRVGGLQAVLSVPLVGFHAAVQDLLDWPDNPLSSVGLQSAAQECIEHAEDFLYDHKNDNSPEPLSKDEIAAIMLYSMPYGFYEVLNKFLREPDRSRLQPFLKYLRLMGSAFSKLPPIHTNVLRGVRKGKDWAKFYEKGRKFFWWGFSSATIDGSVLENNTQFLGTQGDRTLFQIETTHAVSIAKYSLMPAEREVLFGPGTRFEVVSHGLPLNQLVIVGLAEIKPSILWSFADTPGHDQVLASLCNSIHATGWRCPVCRLKLVATQYYSLCMRACSVCVHWVTD